MKPLTCERCRKTDWDVYQFVLRGKIMVLCVDCAKIERIANDGT